MHCHRNPKSLFEGGKQERELAQRYRNWSQLAENFLRTSAMLKRIADEWDQQGNVEDTRAAQDKLKY